MRLEYMYTNKTWKGRVGYSQNTTCIIMYSKTKDIRWVLVFIQSIFSVPKNSMDKPQSREWRNELTHL